MRASRCPGRIIVEREVLGPSVLLASHHKGKPLWISGDGCHGVLGESRRKVSWDRCASVRIERQAGPDNMGIHARNQGRVSVQLPVVEIESGGGIRLGRYRLQEVVRARA